MSSNKVVIVGGLLEEMTGYTLLKLVTKALGADFVVSRADTEDEVIASCHDGAVTLIESPKTPFTRRVIERLDQCRMLLRCGVGFDNIDIEAATQQRIVVCNAPDYCSEEVSDHAVALLMACARRIIRFHQCLRTGGWVRPELGGALRRVKAQTLGIVGLGRIGRRVARKMGGFGMRLITSDPYLPSDIPALYRAELTSLDAVLKESDYFSLHVPLNSETYHMIGEPQLRLMKPGAFLINTSRGKVVDEPALIKALQEGWIAGAALDVMENEPLPADSPLRSMSNVILSPHYAADSVESIEDLDYSLSSYLEAFLRGFCPQYPLNPDVNPKLPLKPWREFAPSAELEKHAPNRGFSKS